MARSTHKDDRRARLLRALIDVVAREGYPQASIAQAISIARVSRSTFYEHFEDKLDCFLAGERELSERAFATVEGAVHEHEGEAEEVTHTVLRALVQLAEQDPTGTRVLLSESLAAGPRATGERERFMSRIEHLVEDAWADPPAKTPVLDVPVRALVGGTCRLLSLRILRGASGTLGLLPDLLAWTDAYTRTSGEPRWRTLDHAHDAPLPRSPHAETPPSPPAAPLPPGRHGLPAAYVSANQRERILHATTAAVLRKGYTDTTIADIVAEAHLTRAVFYQHFRDKQAVLAEINQTYFQQTMAVSARAFFSAESWPERAWEGIHAAGELNADNPSLARIGFVETNSIGPKATRRIYDLVMAFAVFLEEGYRQRPEAQKLPRLCSEAIATALLELFYREITCGRIDEFRELIPTVGYIALAPFMGPEQADAFIEQKLRRP